MKKAARFSLIAGGTFIGILVLGIFVFLIFTAREGQSKDVILTTAVSPDGHRRLQLHQVITPVHGGADHFDITMGEATAAFGDTVYSRQYECDDFKSFRLWWTDSTHANIRFGPYDTGFPEDRKPTTPPKSLSWKDVTIFIDGSSEAANK